MVVSVKDAFWVSERVLVSGQLPDDDSFVYRSTGQMISLFIDLLSLFAHLVKPSRSCLGSPRRWRWP